MNWRAVAFIFVAFACAGCAPRTRFEAKRTEEAADGWSKARTVFKVPTNVVIMTGGWQYAGKTAVVSLYSSASGPMGQTDPAIVPRNPEVTAFPLTVSAPQNITATLFLDGKKVRELPLRFER